MGGARAGSLIGYSSGTTMEKSVATIDAVGAREDPRLLDSGGPLLGLLRAGAAHVLTHVLGLDARDGRVDTLVLGPATGTLGLGGPVLGVDVEDEILGNVDAERESMKDLIPRSPAEIRQEIEEERFLRGEGPG